MRFKPIGYVGAQGEDANVEMIDVDVRPPREDVDGEHKRKKRRSHKEGAEGGNEKKEKKKHRSKEKHRSKSTAEA